ncbi:MAG: DUF6364 family protein [Candidatus Cyclonatronum sp.]|uniref:DUF6364 family protein n=1 Tax=Cyclonatronum sp. TaxID=3024185 RepID=UPI0025C2FBAB|nr:DUF6364 family protein [Cyclonatronum sp.]MCC5935527.1 hypothetical protein [Balneolales bacterium]MCH8487480.1 DUF6364 family protein [Cyclonatronum sp.]
MKEKLTLLIDKETLERTRRQARLKGISLSQMVEDYLQKASAAQEEIHHPDNSVLDEILGCITLDERKTDKEQIENARASRFEIAIV